MCPLSFNVYGMKLNEGNFSFGAVIIHFWDKPDQKINLTSPLNSVLIKVMWLNEKNTVRFE